MISINDNVDTLKDGWDDAAFFAAWHHERSNRETANRIKRTQKNRFLSGGVVQFTIFGYLKPPGTKTDADLQKDPDAEPFVEGIFQRLNAGASYAEVADWLNENGVKPGPHCRNKCWSGPMVDRWIHHPILKGERTRGGRYTVRHNATGRRKTKKGDPPIMLRRSCPHLAYITPAEYDCLIQSLDQRNTWCRRAQGDQPDPRQDVPRKRTVFPGQHARCGVCGRLMYWHGMKSRKVLVCKGATDYHCWNSLFVNGDECARRVLKAAVDAIAQLPSFDDVFGQLIRNQHAELHDRRAAEFKMLERQHEEMETQVQKLLDILITCPKSAAARDRLYSAETQLSELRHRLEALKAQPAVEVQLPAADERRVQAVTALMEADVDDQEVCRLLREVIPELWIMPYQVCDESDIVPRAEITVSLTSLLPPDLAACAEAEVFQRRLVVDLCDPSQRVVYRTQAAELQAAGLKEREIGARLKMAQSAVQRALRMHRLCQTMGLSEPYVRLTELPKQSNRLRRHRHSRYRFQPIDGFPLLR